MTGYSTPLMIRQAVAPRDWVTQPTPTDSTNTCADMTDEQLKDAIAEADSTIDGYLARYYKTPVEAALPAGQIHPVDYWSRNLAAYNATLTYSERLDFTDQDPIARRFLATMDLLKQVANGTLTLDGLKLPGDGGSATASGASAPHQPYTGDLFDAADFNLSPAGSGGAFLDGGWPRPWWGGGSWW